jgi:hypothetical protein
MGIDYIGDSLFDAQMKKAIHANLPYIKISLAIMIWLSIIFEVVHYYFELYHTERGWSFVEAAAIFGSYTTICYIIVEFWPSMIIYIFTGYVSVVFF